MARSTRSGRRGLGAAIAAGLPVILAVAACGPTGPTLPSVQPGATQQLVSPVVSSADPAPTTTPVPGFEVWTTLDPSAMRISRVGDELVLELTASVLWFEAQRGALFSTEVTGDFRLTATVRTARSSDPETPPGGDGTIQLAGLMARADGSAENYLLIATGSIGGSAGIETRSTTASRSVSTKTSRAVGDAELRLCRNGETLRTAFRPTGTTDPWVPVTTFDRPDLPATLQVGASLSTDAAPDLVARFEGLTIEPLRADEAC